MLYLERELVAGSDLQQAAISAAELVNLPVVQQQVQLFVSQGNDADLKQCKTINVLQGESAVVNTDIESCAVVLSSLEATTCCVVVLACRASGRYAIGHYDQSCIQGRDCLSDLLKGMVSPNLYIAGGYCEQSSVGHSVASALLSAAHTAGLPIHLQLALVDSLNTTSSGCPRVCNLGLYVSTQEERIMQMPQTTDKGPALMERMAKQWLQPCQQLVEIYSSSQQAVVVPEVHVQLTPQQAYRYHKLLSLPDAQLLQFMSTSPQHEADTFVSGTYTVCKFAVKSQYKADTPSQAQVEQHCCHCRDARCADMDSAAQ